MEDIIEQKAEHKVIVGFKCAPSLRASLCGQADKLGVSLSSYMETLVLTQEENRIEILTLKDLNKSLTERLSFYENAFLRELFEKYKGRIISYKNRDGKPIQLIINSLQDIFTIITNSFKLTR